MAHGRESFPTANLAQPCPGPRLKLSPEVVVVIVVVVIVI